MVNESIEILKEKQADKRELMKEVKDIQAETEEKFNKLIDITDAHDSDFQILEKKLMKICEKLEIKDV